LTKWKDSHTFNAMALSKRHVSEKRHSFRGERKGKRLTDWLNAGTGKDRQRIIGIVEDLQSMTVWSQQLRARHGHVPMDDVLEQLDRRINSRLAFYKGAIPQISAIDELGRGVFRLLVRGSSKIKIDEWDALELTTGLSKEGLIDNIRHCDGCGSWLFARFSHERFCTEECRLKHFRSSENFKEQRREYARKLYALKRDGKVRSWKLRERDSA
jgi:hypothetical protein